MVITSTESYLSYLNYCTNRTSNNYYTNQLVESQYRVLKQALTILYYTYTTFVLLYKPNNESNNWIKKVIDRFIDYANDHLLQPHLQMNQ